MDWVAVKGWIATHVAPTGPIEVAHERPWSTVLRVPITDGVVWFKACGAVQAFEPRLSAALFTHWPDRVPEVIAHDVDRAWLLLADAGRAVGSLGNPPSSWLDVLPRYAELQIGEVDRADEHVANGVPDLRVTVLPSRYDDLLRGPLPVTADEVSALRRQAGRFTGCCEELSACGVPDSIQHDDLHMNNVYVRDDHLRVLDWGDASVSHPFASLVVTFRFLRDRNGLAPDDAWFARLRDAYLEPWGTGLREAFTLASQVGAVAHAIAWARQRRFLSAADRREFDTPFASVLRGSLLPG